MNTINASLDARERGDTHAAAHAPHTATLPPALQGKKESGAGPGARNPVLNAMSHAEYLRQAGAMGYAQGWKGDWYHKGLDFSAPVARVDGRIDFAITLMTLGDRLADEHAQAISRRFIAGVTLVVILVLCLAVFAVWPGRAWAQTASDEAARLAQLQTATPGTLIRRCDEPYSLPAKGLGALQCVYPAQGDARLRISVESGSDYVLASIARTRRSPGYVLVTLYNPTDAPQSGVAVIEAWAP